MLEKVFHPSHNNVWMYEEIVKYLCAPGDIVLDPMAGAGTVMYTARQGVQVVCIELGPYFSEMLEKNKDAMAGSLTPIIHGSQNCLDILPEYSGQAQAIVFSPPYANELQVGTGHMVYEKENTKYGAGIEKFTYKHKANLGNMKQFMFNRMMRQVYAAILDALQPGGFMCIIIKDRIDGGVRIPYGFRHYQMAYQAGFIKHRWERRPATGSLFGHHNLKRGFKQVQDEHIIFMQKEG